MEELKRTSFRLSAALTSFGNSLVPDRAEARAVAALVENVYRTLNAASGNGLLWRQPPIRVEIGRQASSQDGPVLRIMRWDWENRFVMWVTYGFCSGPEAP